MRLLFGQLRVKKIALGWDAHVDQIMTTDVATIERTTPLNKVIQLMLSSAQKRIVVVDASKHVEGIISDSDLITHAPVDARPVLLKMLTPLWTPNKTIPPASVINLQQTAVDVMTSPVVTVPVGTSARQALRLILEKQVKRLPVVDADGRLVGLVGRAGLMRALLTEPSEVSKMADIEPYTHSE